MEFQPLSLLHHLFEVFLHLIEVNEVNLLGFNLGSVLMAYTYLIETVFGILNPSMKNLAFDEHNSFYEKIESLRC